MTLDAADVPDLIGALADRFEIYNIGFREARHITIEMLEAAFAEISDFEDDSRNASGWDIWDKTTSH